MHNHLYRMPIYIEKRKVIPFIFLEHAYIHEILKTLFL